MRGSRIKKTKALASIVDDSFKRLLIKIDFNNVPFAENITLRTLDLASWINDMKDYFVIEINKLLYDWKNQDPLSFRIISSIANYNQNNLASRLLASRALNKEDFVSTMDYFYKSIIDNSKVYQGIIKEDRPELIVGDPVKKLINNVNSLLWFFEIFSPLISSSGNESHDYGSFNNMKRTYDLALDQILWIISNTDRKSVPLRSSFYSIAKYLKNK